MKFQRKKINPAFLRGYVYIPKLPDSNMSYRFLQINRGGNGKRLLGEIQEKHTGIV
ncbi:8225_t:CDS:1, partial [Funneliformis caledonium]